MKNDPTYVKAKFHPYLNQSRDYTYQTTLNPELGSFAVVKTPSTGFQIVKIVGIDVEHPSFECKPLVQLVDDTAYNELTVPSKSESTSKHTAKKRV